MSEQDEKVGTDAEDVELHRRKFHAADEPGDEIESKDDVELHGKRRTAATDEQRDESESDDDVELHGQKRKAL